MRPDPTTPTGAHTWLVLARAARAVEAHALRSIADTGLGASDFVVLEVLLHKGALPVNAIGRRVLLTSGSITTCVDRLERRGLVARREDPDDLRVRHVELTPAGRALIEPAFARHAADLEALVQVLGAEERATLVTLLRRLGTAAEGKEEGNGTTAHSEEAA